MNNNIDILFLLEIHVDKYSFGRSFAVGGSIRSFVELN